MSGWGIVDTASEIEKIKAESADYLKGLNSCCLIDWNTYDKAFDFYMGLIDASYEQGKKDAEQRWIPCTPDTMPKKPEQVLIYAWNVHYVLAKYREIRTGEGIYKMAWVVEDAYHAPFEIKHDVIAWMPLPEPWREENR